MNQNELYWLAGLLEGEGGFNTWQPHNRRYPTAILQLCMTDEDTVKRAAKLMKHHKAIVSYELPSGKTAWRVQLVQKEPLTKLLFKLQPLMGKRKQDQIETMLWTLHNNHRVKL